MDDQDWAELDAPIAPAGNTPEEAIVPSGTVEALGLQETQVPDTTEQTTEQVAEASATDTPGESESVPEEVHAKIVELERKLAERDAAEAAKQEAWQSKLAAYQEAENQKLADEDSESSTAFYEELKQTDPAWAEQFQERRNYLSWDRDRARVEANGSYSALEAATLVMEYHLTPDLMQKIVADATDLAQYPTFEQKIRILQARRQAAQTESAETQRLRSEVQELRVQMEAMNRPLQADVVEGGRTGGGGSFQQQWDNATDFDEAFALIS